MREQKPFVGGTNAEVTLFKYKGKLGAGMMLYSPKNGTIIHEFGHVLGLAHDSSKYSIMNGSSSFRVLPRIEQVDLKLLRQKYAQLFK
jgi:predicted Zn-dependent protease